MNYGESDAAMGVDEAASQSRPIVVQMRPIPSHCLARAGADRPEGGQHIGSLLQLINLIGLGSLQPLIVSQVMPNGIKGIVEVEPVSFWHWGAMLVDYRLTLPPPLRDAAFLFCGCPPLPVCREGWRTRHAYVSGRAL